VSLICTADPDDRSSSLYLFTFLITIVVLGLISGGLLLRAYYVRRQFQRRVEEAILSGQPLPEDAALALGIRHRMNNNAKKEKKHGPMPNIWEAEMYRDGERWETGRSEKADWEDITVSRGFSGAVNLANPQPLSITHEAPPPPPPEPIDPTSLLPQKRGPWFLSPFLTPRMPDLRAYVAAHPNVRPGLVRTLTAISLPPIKPVWTIPEDGEEVTVGVLIAMPTEGSAAERWDVDAEDAEEAEVPEVCMGVMATSVKFH